MTTQEYFTRLLDNPHVRERARIDSVMCRLVCDDDNKHIARLFAVWCARQALVFIESPNKHFFIAACDVAERFALENATSEELKIAYYNAARCTAPIAKTPTDCAAIAVVLTTSDIGTTVFVPIFAASADYLHRDDVRKMQLAKLRELIMENIKC